MLERYKATFSKLRSDTSAARWSAETNHRAPHKPFLLLTVMDLIAQGEITTNFIEFNAELLDTFDLYWARVIGQAKQSSPIYPFYHLKSDGFWHLVPVPGQEQSLSVVGPIRSLRQMNELVLGARVDDELFTLLVDREARDQLRRVLVETCFAPDIRPKLVEIGQIASESFSYSRELLGRSHSRFRVKEVSEIDEQYLVESRSTAFRRVIVKAYKHTCAMCGIRILTPEGRSAVAAAHIVPWSHSRNDDPRNGMALCGLHHWTFDQGLITVTADYHVRVSPAVSRDDEATQPVLLLADREIKRPDEQYLWPAKEALHWHSSHIFRSEVSSRLL